jgi:hypothetical protein
MLLPHNGPLCGLRGRTQTLSGGPVGWKKCGAPRGCPPHFFHRHPLLLSVYASPCRLGGPLWGRCGVDQVPVSRSFVWRCLPVLLHTGSASRAASRRLGVHYGAGVGGLGVG